MVAGPKANHNYLFHKKIHGTKKPAAYIASLEDKKRRILFYHHRPTLADPLLYHLPYLTFLARKYFEGTSSLSLPCISSARLMAPGALAHAHANLFSLKAI